MLQLRIDQQIRRVTGGRYGQSNASAERLLVVRYHGCGPGAGSGACG